MTDTITAELPIPEGLEETVAKLPEGALSAWQVPANVVHESLKLKQQGQAWHARRPGWLRCSWLLCSHLEAAARMRIDDALDVRGEAVDAAREMLPWLAPYDLVTQYGVGRGMGATYTFWRTQRYEPVPAGTYLLECWYVSSMDRDSVTFGWKVPALGRVIHQRLPLKRAADGGPDRECWRAIKRLLKLLEIYDREYPYFPGFNTALAQDRCILADVSVEPYTEDHTGVEIWREVVSNERPWIDPARATFSL